MATLNETESAQAKCQLTGYILFVLLVQQDYSKKCWKYFVKDHGGCSNNDEDYLVSKLK
jgi:hypothetical protein